jgi:hypothetical protein
MFIPLLSPLPENSQKVSKPITYPVIPDFKYGKYVISPIQKNSLIVRFENIADVFDSFSNDTSSLNIKVDVVKFAYELYASANDLPSNFFLTPGAEVPIVEIKEVSLTGNQDWESMVARRAKYNWVADSD